MIEICETCARHHDSGEWAGGQGGLCPDCRAAVPWSPAAGPFVQLDEVFDAPYERPPSRRASAKAALMVFAAILASASAMGAVAERAAIVRAAPAAARLFAAIGLPVNLRGLALEAVQANLSDADGKQMLTVEGAVVNLRNETTESPPLRIALRDAQKREIYVWTAEALTAKLGPGERATFRTRLAAPPQGALDIMVRFASASEPLSPIEGGL
jgi:hypothetical protein